LNSPSGAMNLVPTDKAVYQLNATFSK